jgi:hypothetical protein
MIKNVPQHGLLVRSGRPAQQDNNVHKPQPASAVDHELAGCLVKDGAFYNDQQRKL